MPEPTITVRGRGRASAIPDGVQMRIGVRAHSDSPQEAHDEASRRLAEIEALLAELGIESSSWTTALISMWEDERWNEQHRVEQVTHRANAEIQVGLRDPALAGRLVAESVTRAQAKVDGPWWSILESNPAWDAAWSQAVEDATRKASAIAAALRMSLGPVVQVTEGAAPEPGGRWMRSPLSGRVLAGSEMEIHPGGLDVVAVVDATFALVVK